MYWAEERLAVTFLAVSLAVSVFVCMFLPGVVPFKIKIVPVF